MNKQVKIASCEFSSLSREQTIKLWHRRLGHPSFPYLKKLFLSLFKNNDVFGCEVCQLAKHMHSNFPAKSYEASQPFTLIHSDIWGPSRV